MTMKRLSQRILSCFDSQKRVFKKITGSKNNRINLVYIGKIYNSVFHRFRQGKIACGGSILSSRHFLLLPQLPQKVKMALKVAKNDLKIKSHYSNLNL
jgi:hypothetical protein